jgi:hypothetical protein
VRIEEPDGCMALPFRWSVLISEHITFITGAADVNNHEFSWY